MLLFYCDKDIESDLSWLLFERSVEKGGRGAGGGVGWWKSDRLCPVFWLTVSIPQLCGRKHQRPLSPDRLSHSSSLTDSTFAFFFFPDQCNFESVAASVAKIWLPVRGLFLKMGHLWCDCSAGAAFTPKWTSCQKKKTTLLLRYLQCTPSCITLAVVDFLRPDTKNPLCAPCKDSVSLRRGIRFGVNFASADMMNTDRVRGKSLSNLIWRLRFWRNSDVTSCMSFSIYKWEP